MKTLTLTAVSALALTTAACGQAATSSAIATGKLDCPSQQGELRRVSATPDGKSCVYKIADGAEMTLSLMPVSGGGADATLAQIEAQLKAETAGPHIADPAAKPDKAEKTADSSSESDAARAVAEAQADADAAQGEAAEAMKEADRATRQAEREARHAERDARHADRDAQRLERDSLDRSIEDRVNAKLREKGIDVDDKGGRAQFDMPGIHVNADSERADVHVGPIHVDANGDTATIRSLKDVRLRGEAFSRAKRGIRAMFLYAGDDLGGGYKYVGYEAAGLRTGPLVVAVVKSKVDSGFHGDIYGDVKRLVRRNGGV